MEKLAHSISPTMPLMLQLFTAAYATDTATWTRWQATCSSWFEPHALLAQRRSS